MPAYPVAMNKISTINKVNRCYTLLEQEFQREPTEEEIAEKMDMTPEEVKENMKIATKPWYLWMLL